LAGRILLFIICADNRSSPSHLFSSVTSKISRFQILDLLSNTDQSWLTSQMVGFCRDGLVLLLLLPVRI
jgi:hypothetical protein